MCKPHTSTYISILTCTCMCTFAYTHMNVCLYICIHVHVHAPYSNRIINTSKGSGDQSEHTHTKGRLHRGQHWPPGTADALLVHRQQRKGQRREPGASEALT